MTSQINSSIAATIAAFPDPFKSLPGEMPFYQTMTLSMQQGREEFRKLIIQLRKENYHLFSAESLREIAKTNLQLYLFLTAKIVGHAFNFTGQVFKQNEYAYEGFNEAFNIPVICSSFEKFAKSHPHLISLESAKKVIDALTHSVHSETITDSELEVYIKQITSGDLKTPLVVNAGYDNHSAPLIFYRNSIYNCNRGAYPIMQESGITRLVIEKKHYFTTELAKRLFKRMNVVPRIYKEVQNALKELCAKTIHHMKYTPQKTGNCTFANVALTLVVLISITENCHLGYARMIYKKWKAFFRESLLNSLSHDYTYFKTHTDVQAVIGHLAIHAMSKHGLKLSKAS